MRASLVLVSPRPCTQALTQLTTNPETNNNTTMKMNKWTQVLLGVGLVSIPAVTHAEEQLSQLRTELTSTTISGYVDTTMTWKSGQGNANMPGRVYDGADTQDSFNLNVVSITLAKPLDESEWAAGYNVQTLFGPGASKRGTGSIRGGVPAGPGPSTGADVAFNEAVVLLRVPVGNGIDFKIGQFGTFNGYEAYDTYKNPNWSRSYGFYIESSAHTGVAASYKIGESITVMGGIANMAGFNNQVDALYSQALSESEKAYLAMVNWTLPENAGFLKGASLSVGYTGGAQSPVLPGADWWQENYYVGFSLPTPISGMAVGLAFDYTSGMQYNDSWAETIGAYVSFQATEKLKLNGRADWAKGNNGVAGASDGAFGYYSTGDGRNELFSLTATADYALWKNVISRLEFRWDTTLTSDTPFGGTVDAPAGTVPADGDKTAVSLTANFIYQF
jgi:hypothetical protein